MPDQSFYGESKLLEKSAMLKHGSQISEAHTLRLHKQSQQKSMHRNVLSKPANILEMYKKSFNKTSRQFYHQSQHSSDQYKQVETV